MSEDFVEVYSKTTKAKQMVPQHFLDNPVLGKDFALTAAGREQVRINTGASLDWSLGDLEAHADAIGADRTGLRTKPEVLGAITAHLGTAPTNSPETGSTGPGGVTPDADENTDDPAPAGENQE
jgi:hypothetical protein